ncbi:hypothetical protein [Stieleria varia]|uniref:Uncharacterized protein n=1 Tax=Stieleria varia TaxID=2528005 RepID=A0A5C6ASM5_9BACT|nr:hypothetical protein [Stieleria varia]TWU02995.1 hypothetical protein Pla52n_40840 [Stieleria varia]
MPDFDKIARRLTKNAYLPLDDQVEQLQRLCPDVVCQLEQDSGRGGPLIFWGTCRNVDELAGKVIVDPGILKLIFRVAEQRLDIEFPHAGLQHTYGYLFSVINTPYGKKRERWTSDALEHSLALPSDTLSPAPATGTLLANATWLAGNIAFRGHARRNWLIRCLRKRVASAMGQLDIDAMTRLRSVETISLQRDRGRDASVSLITDLLRLPQTERGAEEWLLVYSVNDSRKPHPEIITLFTVAQAFVQAVRERSAKGKLDDIRLRYNAWVPGFPAAPQSGTVRLVTE